MNTTSFDGIARAKERQKQVFGRGIDLKKPLCGWRSHLSALATASGSALTQCGCNARNQMVMLTLTFLQSLKCVTGTGPQDDQTQYHTEQIVTG